MGDMRVKCLGPVPAEDALAGWSRARLAVAPNYAGHMEEGVVETSASDRRAAPGETTSVALTVDGMHCQSCAALIEETLVRVPGVEVATVDLAAARATVTFDGSALSLDDLCATVASVGYGASVAASGRPAS
jgi:copper chaperone CopZ